MPKRMFASSDFSFPSGWLCFRDAMSAGPLSSKWLASAERTVNRLNAQQILFMSLAPVIIFAHEPFTRVTEAYFQFELLLTSRCRRSESRRRSDDSEP